MRLLADESCDFSVVVGVRSAGHDVTSIMELMSGVDDEKVIEVAASERRARSTLVAAVVKLLSDRGEGLYNRFVVLEPGRIRVTQLEA